MFNGYPGTGIVEASRSFYVFYGYLSHEIEIFNKKYTKNEKNFVSAEYLGKLEFMRTSFE